MKKNGAKHCLHLEPERSCTSALLRNAAVAAAVQQMETLVGLSVRPRHVSTPRGGSFFVMAATKSPAGRRTLRQRLPGLRSLMAAAALRTSGSSLRCSRGGTRPLLSLREGSDGKQLF